MTVKIGKTADELLEERVARARLVFATTQIHQWECKAREDAEAGDFKPPSAQDLILAVDVYMQAYNRRRYKIAKAKREAG